MSRERGARAHRVTTLALGCALVGVGAAVLARTVEHGGAPLSPGVIIGLVMIGIGAARLWQASRSGGMDPDSDGAGPGSGSAGPEAGG